MSSSGDSRGSGSPTSSAGRPSLSTEENPNVIQPATICSSLECIPHGKLTSRTFINKGAYGTVYKAFHEDWRVKVAVKFFPSERHLVERERSKILKEAEILHKARFSYILPILGICNENGNLGIVTEYMRSGSLNQLLHEENTSLKIVWPIRFRILYEIALGVNFLHNMSPPLLHHDLKTQNILLDSEYHVKLQHMLELVHQKFQKFNSMKARWLSQNDVLWSNKIADFGLSKWRMLSSSKSLSEHSSPEGTIIYMPPEEYDPTIKNKRGSVKHDMYSYSIIMWEVLTRKQPYEGAITPVQIMFSVTRGNRPDISEESLSFEVPHREVFVSLMQSGWANDPNERPAFLKCLLELEPIVRKYDDITILEGILQIKRARIDTNYSLPPCSSPSEVLPPTSEQSHNSSNEDVHSRVIDNSASICSDKDHFFPGALISTTPDNRPSLDSSCSYFNTINPISFLDPVQESSAIAHNWVQSKRTEIVNQMTEACLNQCLDALLSKRVILKEDYEHIKAQTTRCSKVRQLIDTSDIQGEIFSKIIVEKLRENRQNDLMPFPEF